MSIPRKLWRYAVYFVYISFVRFTPEVYRPYRLFFPWLRRVMVSQFADRCGAHVVVKHNADISPHISIGDRSELGTRCMIHGNVSIGKNVLMGPDVKIFSRNHIYQSLAVPIKDQGKISRPTVIGDDVWIGANVIIFPGVAVGDHVVIGAGAVVTKNVPDYAVIAGNPAQIVKMRNS